MKAIVCEMCSSHDVVKDGEFYVCQSCGTKYTAENAKKLMVEVEGSVKVDQSGALNNYLTLARQAKQEGNLQNAAQYYELAKAIDGSNWESYFYSVYYRAASCTLANLIQQAENVSNCVPYALSLIKENVPAEKQIAACDEIAASLKSLRIAFVDSSNRHYNQFSSVEGSGAERIKRCRASYNMEYVAGKAIFEKFGYKNIALGLLNDCTAYGSSHMDAVQVSKAIAHIDPSAAKISMEREKSNIIHDSMRYVYIAVCSIILGVFIGIITHHFGVFSWICIGIGLLFIVFFIIDVVGAKSKVRSFDKKQ